MHLDAITRQQRGDFVATCNSEALQLFCKGTAATGRPALDINIQTKIFISKRPYSTRPRAPRRLRGRPRARRDAITRQRCVDFVATFHLSSFATYCKGTAANGRPALNIGIHTKLLISKRPYSTRPRAPWRLRGRPRARHDVVARQRRGDFVATCNSEALHLFCKGTAANGRPALDIGIHTKLFISKRPYSMRPRTISLQLATLKLCNLFAKAPLPTAGPRSILASTQSYSYQNAPTRCGRERRGGCAGVRGRAAT